MLLVHVSWIVLGLRSEIVSSPWSAGGMEWEGCDSRAAAFTDSSFPRRREQLSPLFKQAGRYAYLLKQRRRFDPKCRDLSQRAISL